MILTLGRLMQVMNCRKESLRNVPKQNCFVKRVCQMLLPWKSCLRAQYQREKNAWTPSSQIPKESSEGFGDSSDSKEFVDLQCQSPMDVDPMDVECPLLSRVEPKMNKG